MACALLALAFSLVFPRLTQYVVDTVIVQGQSDRLGWVALGLMVAFFFRDLFNGLRIRLNNEFEQRVIKDMRCEVYAQLQRLPVTYFDQRASGDLMTRVIEDVNSVERILIDGTEQGTVAVLSLVGTFLMLWLMDPVLAAWAMIPLPLLAGGGLWYTLTAHRRYRWQRQAASAMNALLMDNLQGVRQIKIFGREPEEDLRFAGRAEALRQGTLAVMRAWAYYSPSMSFAAALGTVLVLWLGGRQVMAGTMTLGELVAFLFYLGLFYEPVSRLHGLNQMLQAARAAGERVFDILDQPRERPEPGRQLTWSGPVRGEVTFDHVAFSYPGDRPALRAISFRAAPGQMVALVGPTGAGKSTIVNLLPAFYEASAGIIRVDGHDIRHLSLQALRAKISIVSQEPFLFNGTLAENIRFGRPDASSEALLKAAQAAHCHEFILGLPQQYETLVGERGVRLSVGERQRVSIARALLKDAPILILDEATASVDTATERLIQDALQRLMQGRTSLVIAHRLSTIRRADLILVIRGGEIVERGTHEQLLQQGGLYARLAQIQNATSIEDGFERLACS
jgi:ABC-type multidrug transport system fused ATPase/permease subunit